MTARRPLSAETAARLVGLADMVKAERARRGLSLRAAGAQLGVPASTLMRLEKGQLPDVPNFLAILAWLDVPLAPLFGDRQAKTFDAYQRGWDDCAATVTAALKRGDAP
jgi:transcriptional regulator with XRE-family HTH domain